MEARARELQQDPVPSPQAGPAQPGERRRRPGGRLPPGRQLGRGGQASTPSSLRRSRMTTTCHSNRLLFVSF